MNLILLIATAWVLGVICAWAFVHGAQKLRRREAASLHEAAQ